MPVRRPPAVAVPAAVRRHLALLLVAAALLAGAVLAPARPAGAQAGEVVPELDVLLRIEDDGTLVVRETWVYDFGGAQRRGLERTIPVRFRYDDTHDRVYPLEVVDVETSEGAPDDVTVEPIGGDVRIRVGDPDVFITGTHTYVLEYVVQGALNAFPDHDELYWNVVGTDFRTPIEQVEVRLEAPAEVTQVACFAGPPGSTLPCAEAEVEGDAATFAAGPLAPFEAFTVVAGIPTGVVPPPQPVLEERWSFARAFAVTPATAGTAGVLLAAVLGGLGWLLWRTGRDRRWAGGPVDAAFGGDGADGGQQRVGLLDRPEVPVEFVPPDGVRPGQVGTLVDETAHPLDVTATIVDLAVRGYLRIEEVPGSGRSPDWRLVRLRQPDAALHDYERLLHEELFARGGQVLLSELKYRFAPRLRRVQSSLYDDVVRQGWFPHRPDHVRAFWVVIGGLALAVGVGLVVVAAMFTRFALVPVPLALGGLLLLAGSRWMPHRTARGTGVLRRVQGFRRFIEESEADRARFAERQHLFSEYLPYAIVFGATEQWAKRFAGLDAEMATASWYVGVQPFHPVVFASSIDSFAVTTTGTVASTPPSTSGSSGFGGGGFSGGGGGGGGGGSW